MTDHENSKPNFVAFIGWGFQALILAVGTWGVSELSMLSRSVQELNVKMAVVVERDTAREKRTDGLEFRVQRLEEKRRPSDNK